MVDSMLRRHSAGPVYQVSSYVAACYALDVESIAAEYSVRVAAAPIRSSGYIVDHDTSGRKPDSRRNEELLAHRLFLMGSTISFRDWHPVEIVDFQTPLNAARRDGLGKVVSHDHGASYGTSRSIEGCQDAVSRGLDKATTVGGNQVSCLVVVEVDHAPPSTIADLRGSLG